MEVQIDLQQKKIKENSNKLQNLKTTKNSILSLYRYETKTGTQQVQKYDREFLLEEESLLEIIKLGQKNAAKESVDTIFNRVITTIEN